ncbi:T9SS type A sorting domain-containing protein [Chitinophaga agrisoli]|uniref:T9SS type A sorting domain-containing protein n=1 Tax=Chitinophaga agrisoli TaxID=2607653 RepID=A0A5B2VR02_9BACT|nr:T9SS type A sorting domain-containing protein [Chitinophaga agrisoli]KAA2240579.1 T9SS type A sorting domain-containing protein [Chitinophaga agrisoli]
MKRLLLLLAFVSCHCFLHAQSITFLFPEPGMPAENGIWKDTGINVTVTPFAPGQVTAVTAAAAGRQLSLRRVPNGSYTGRLSLQGVPGDTLTLLITARDTLQNTGDTAISFIYRPVNDPSISLRVDSLADSAVARPVWALHARCNTATGSGNIAVYNTAFPEQLIATGTDSIPSLDLSAYNGHKLGIRIVATDSIGRTAEKRLTVFIESSPYLTPYLTAKGAILDFRYNKALLADTVTGFPFLVDAANGQRTGPLIARAVDRTFPDAYVTPEGALFKVRSDTMTEWKNGQAIQQRANRLDVSGQYAAWFTDGNLIVKNLSTGDSTIGEISPDTIGFFNGNLDVGPNGLTALEISPFRTLSNVYTFHNGQFTNISQGPPDHSPLTDGTNVIYYKEDSGLPLYLYNGQTTTLLGTPGSSADGTFGGPFVDYQLNNRYAAFVKEGQINLMDTSGVVHQQGVFNYCPSCDNRVRIDLLNEKGELMVSIPDSGRYFISRSGQRKRVTNMPDRANEQEGKLSRSFFDNGQWYVLIGNTLFKVNTDTLPPNHISSFEKTVKPDSILAFTADDFTANFSGPGQLLSISFTSLPAHGVLKYFNSPLSPGAVINRANLAQLSYIPDAAFTGTDSIRWIASNGVDNTVDTAAIYIHVTDSITVVPVPQPVISGLHNSYCNAEGPAPVKILNLPVPDITVQVLLDSTTVLPVAADSTFTITPASLTPGKHTVTIAFSYDTAHKQLTRQFTITPAVTPDVTLSVNVNPIISDTIPVVITATNVTGGGKQPLYAFAWDAGFTDLLQIEGTANTATVTPAEFKLGDNWVYVRMQTSDACAATATATDSIRINKTNITAITDVDAPGKAIHIFPNPFRGDLYIRGLQPNRSYIISLYNVQGSLLYRQRTVNNTQAQLHVPVTGGRLYFLSVYDEQKKKTLGTEQLLGY